MMKGYRLQMLRLLLMAPPLVLMQLLLLPLAILPVATTTMIAAAQLLLRGNTTSKLQSCRVIGMKSQQPMTPAMTQIETLAVWNRQVGSRTQVQSLHSKKNRAACRCVYGILSIKLYSTSPLH